MTRPPPPLTERSPRLRITHRHNALKFGKYRNGGGASLLSSVPDIEELNTIGRGHGICPFYLGKDAGAASLNARMIE